VTFCIYIGTIILLDLYQTVITSKYSRIPLARTLVIGIGLALLGKFVENSTKLTGLEITGYRMKYSTPQRYALLELQIRRVRKV
jgi:hypothetical protein